MSYLEETYIIHKDDIDASIKKYFLEYDSMIKDPKLYFSEDKLNQLAPYLSMKTELYYHLGEDIRIKMAGFGSKSLYYFATGICTYLTIQGQPECIKKAIATGTLDLIKKSDFEKGGGWFNYYQSLSETDKVSMINWYNNHIVQIEKHIIHNSFFRTYD